MEKAATLEIKGKIIELLPLKSGQSANGEWRKQEYILETDSQYPKKICFMVWGEKIDQFNINQDDEVEVSVDLESREYNGRWYTDVKAWRVFKKGVGATLSDTIAKGDRSASDYELSRPPDDDGIPF